MSRILVWAKMAYDTVLGFATALIEWWVTFVLVGAALTVGAAWVLFDSGLPGFERGAIWFIMMSLACIVFTGVFDDTGRRRG